MKDNDFIYIVTQAVKAPSTHNTQPWRFSRYGTDSILITADKSRQLPASDSLGNELRISVQCAVYNAIVAALKHSIEAVSIKSSKDLLSYIIKFAERDKTMITPLSDAIDARCCNRNVYDGKTVDRKTLTALAECGALMIPNGSPNYNYIADLVMQGNEALMDNSAARNEMMKWMRYNRKEADEQADGLAFDIIGAPPMPSAIAKPIIGFAMSSSSLNKADLKKIESSSHFAVFASSAAEVGFNLERFLLTASSMGVSCAFLNQPTESYVLAQSLKKRLSLNNEVGAILRIGYGAAPKRSRRRAVNTFIDPDVAQLQEMPVDVKFEI